MRRTQTIDPDDDPGLLKRVLHDDSAIMKEARMVGAAIITIAIIALVVNSIITSTAIDPQPNVDNESVTVNLDPTNVNQTSVSPGADVESYLDNEEVYNSSDDLLVEGTDYDWYTGNGTVQWYGTANISDGESASITYSYNRAGAFLSVITSLQTTGVAAMSLLVVGLLVVAANAILGKFAGGF